MSDSLPIVIQVNPHVHLFFFAPKGTAGRPVAHRKGKGECCRALVFLCVHRRKIVF